MDKDYLSLALVFMIFELWLQSFMLMVPVIFGVHYQYMHYGIAVYFNFSNEYVYFSIMQM